MSMQRKEFNFCFVINRLELIDPIELQLSTYFKLQMYRNNRMIATTPSFLSVINQQSSILFHRQMMKLRLYQENQQSKQICQIRLVQISQEFPQIIIGRYQFLLNNYIKAYEYYNKNRIELNVQIGINYFINYDVFIENSQEAIIRIVKQHQTAKKFIHYEDLSEIQSFLPHQITNENLQEIYKEIKIDQESPLLLSQRFWSPKRKNSKHLKKNSIISLSNEKQTQEITAHSIFDNRISFLKFSKLASSSSQLHHDRYSQYKKDLVQLDIQSQSGSQLHKQNWLQLYQVLQSQSKIIFRQDQLKDKKRETLDGNRIQKGRRSIKKYSNSVKHFILILIIITVLAFFIFLFDRPLLKFAKGRKASSSKRL